MGVVLLQPAGGAGGSARRTARSRLLLRPGDAPAVRADLARDDRACAGRLEEPAAGALLVLRPGLVLILVLLLVVGGLDRGEAGRRDERDAGDGGEPAEGGGA